MIDFGPDTFGWTGEAGVADLLACGGNYIDYAKIYALNSLLMPEDVVARVVRRYTDAGITAYSGGILFEYAHQQGEIDAMLALLDRIGLRTLEISENYLTLAHDERLGFIERFRRQGFRVIYEFGLKNPEEPFTAKAMAKLVDEMTALDVPHVIIEQSEIDMLAKGSSGALTELAQQPWFEKLLIEVDPYRFPQQHAQLLQTFGPEINLANVTPGQVLRLEGLRRGIGRAVDYSLLA
jgi:phosphosulfolactate synthase